MGEVLSAQEWTIDQANSVLVWLQHPSSVQPFVGGIVLARLQRLGISNLDEAYARYSELSGQEADAYAVYIAGFDDSVIKGLEHSKFIETFVPKPVRSAPPKVTRTVVSRALSEHSENLTDSKTSDAHEDNYVDEALGGTRLNADQVRDYLRAISQTPLLSKEQEKELSVMIESGLAARRVLEGDPEYTKIKATREELLELIRQGEVANEQFIKANLRLVVSIAKRYIGRGVPFLDLIQEGNMGLSHAIELFDHTKGFKFSTYATHWIKQAADRAIANTGRAIRIPVHVRETLGKVERARQAFAHDFGYFPSNSELLEGSLVVTQSDLDLEEMIRRQNPVSLTQPIDDDGTELGELIGFDSNQEGVDTTTEREFVRRQIEALLETFLDPREADIVRRRFGFHGDREKIEEIANRHGITKTRVQQIEAKTLSKLRHPSRAYHLRGLLSDR